MNLRQPIRYLVALLLLTPGVLPAQSPSLGQVVAGSVGAVHTKNDGSGLSLSGTYALASEFLSFALTPLDLGFVPGSADPNYESETLSNGTTVCRDLRSGQFAKKENCTAATRVRYAASVHVEGALPIGNNHWMTVGLGYRAGSSNGPFGTVAFLSAPLNRLNWSVRLRGSSEFVDVGLGASMPIPVRKTRAQAPSH